MRKSAAEPGNVLGSLVYPYFPACDWPGLRHFINSAIEVCIAVRYSDSIVYSSSENSHMKFTKYHLLASNGKWGQMPVAFNSVAGG